MELKNAFYAGLEKAAVSQGMEKEAFWGAAWNTLKMPVTKLLGAMTKNPAGTFANLTKTMPTNVTAGALLGGGIGGLSNPENRLGGALAGMGMGALGGAGFSAGEQGFRMMAPKIFGAHWGKLQNIAKAAPGQFWKAPGLGKRLGAKILVGGGAMGGGVAGSSVTEGLSGGAASSGATLPAMRGSTFRQGTQSTNLPYGQ